MIEALQRYSELEKVNSDFYLAEDGYIKKEDDIYTEDVNFFTKQFKKKTLKELSC